MTQHLYRASILLLITVFTSSAQIVTGVVMDADTNEPLAFANIVVMGQPKGTVSNTEGIYVLERGNLAPTDVIIFAYMGYETVKLSYDRLLQGANVKLKPATINLLEVQVLSKSLTALDIIKLIKENFDKNYPSSTEKRRIFYHKYEKTPFPEENKIVLKKTNFVGMDKSTFNELLKMLPREFVEYQDAVVDLYSNGSDHKMIPIQAISLEEGSQKELANQLESKLGSFFKDIEKTKTEKDIYYKFRTGIFAFKDKSDYQADTDSHVENDSLNVSIPTDYVKWEIQNLMKNYAHMDGDNWEFINSSQKYSYEIEDFTMFNDELVYQVSFKPKSKGLYEGLMYVSTKTYAVLQLDFAYAKGKTSENVQLLGFGHSLKFKKGRVIFEKGENGYFVKYINAQLHETASIERDFSIMKKQKRFLIDKELNEIKFETELTFDINAFWEVLVMDRQSIADQSYEAIKQPQKMKFRKEYAYSPDVWTNRTVIAPSAELKEYIRK